MYKVHYFTLIPKQSCRVTYQTLMCFYSVGMEWESYVWRVVTLPKWVCLKWWTGTYEQNLSKEWGIVCLTSVCPSCADSSWALEMPLSASRACPLSSGLMDSVFSRNSFKAPSVSWILGGKRERGR